MHLLHGCMHPHAGQGSWQACSSLLAAAGRQQRGGACEVLQSKQGEARRGEACHEVLTTLSAWRVISCTGVIT